MFQKLRIMFADFMYGRVGIDNLSRALIVAAVTINILTIFFDTTFLIVLNTLVIVWAGYRVFSKDYQKRMEENIAFERMLEKGKEKLKGNSRVKELKKTHCLFKCPRCGLKMKMPKNKGRVVVNCCKCGCEFEQKT